MESPVATKDTHKKKKQLEKEMGERERGKKERNSRQIHTEPKGERKKKLLFKKKRKKRPSFLCAKKEWEVVSSAIGSKLLTCWSFGSLVWACCYCCSYPPPPPCLIVCFLLRVPEEGERRMPRESVTLPIWVPIKINLICISSWAKNQTAKNLVGSTSLSQVSHLVYSFFLLLMEIFHL